MLTPLKTYGSEQRDKISINDRIAGTIVRDTSVPTRHASPQAFSHLNDEPQVHSRASPTRDTAFNKSPTQSPLFEPMDKSSTPSTGVPTSVFGLGSPLLSDMAPTLDGLKRARAMKADINTSLTFLKAKGRKPNIHRRVEEDPENQLIKTLRQDHRMSWDAIASYLNEERLKRGEPGNLTTPAVYSRFVRNGPRIAAAMGEVGFDPKDYMHLRYTNQHPSSSAASSSNVTSAHSTTLGFNFGISAGKKRPRNDSTEETDLKDNLRKRSKLSEQAAELEKEDMTELLMGAVATVERNFWVFVADELERTSSRLFDPKACESRFHTV